MLETLNTIKNELKKQAETQKKLRIVLGQNWNNYHDNYAKTFGVSDGMVPALWVAQNNQRENAFYLFAAYTAYYIVKHRLQDDYSEYKKQVTENSYLSNDDWYSRHMADKFWPAVQSFVECWTIEILNELEQRKGVA